jgi:serine/threonine-protein kinase
MAILHNLHFSAPADARSLRPELADDLIQVVNRMLEKDPARRYQSMADVRADLQRLGERPSSSATQYTRTRSIATVFAGMRSNRQLLAAAGVVLALASASIGWLWLGRRDASQPEGVVAIDAATPHQLYTQARSLLDRFDRDDNVTQAIRLLEQAIEKDPDYAPAYAALTEGYHFRHLRAPDPQWRKLMEVNAERAVALSPDLAAAHIAKGLAAMTEAGRAGEAEARFRRAADMDPRSARPLRWTAAVLRTSGDPAKAAAMLDQAAVLDPKDWAIFQEMGTLRYNRSDYTGAVEAFERAQSLSPDNVRVLTNLAAAYHMLDRTDEAVSTLQRAIEIQPEAVHYTNLGTLRFFQGRYADAARAFERAVEMAPNRYRNWGNLGDAYRWSPGEKAKAPAAYERGIDVLRQQIALKPQDPDLRSTLALYLAKSGKKDDATTELSALDWKKTKSGAVLFRVAVAYEVSGRRDEAIEALGASVKAGYSLREVRDEAELASLRNDVRYHRLIASP